MRPNVFSISGIDGCGKTTVIVHLEQELTHRGLTVRTTWMRFTHLLVKPLLAFCRIAGLTRYTSDTPRVGYHEFWRSRIVSALFVALTWLDLALAIFLRLPGRWRRDRKNTITLCDRFIPDILVDLAIDTGYHLESEARWVRTFLRLAPADCPMFLLERDTADVLACREANRLDRNFARRLELYATLRNAGIVRPVANASSPEEAARTILSLLPLENEHES